MKKILVLEDEENIRSFVVINLRRSGYEPIEAENGEMALEKLKVNLCMECGCCAFICPAHRPLVQVNKLAKGMLRDWQAKEKAQAAKEKARQEQLAQMKKEENK